uniref:Uncharacterized protein n=1 Tax=Hucho hucho TaxID=62062 RepID=A0A4W5Q9J2_9TELE
MSNSFCLSCVCLSLSYLDELSIAGECAAEYLALYQKLIKPPQWKVYLAARGVLPYIGNLITKEIANLLALDEATLSTDLQQGIRPQELDCLLSSFAEVESIKCHFKSLVGTVLNGYLCLRKLVVQTTKLIDETQDMLLEMLEDMTTGTESETKAFMAVCIETAKRYDLDDYRTPVFIFERLCTIIYPVGATLLCSCCNSSLWFNLYFLSSSFLGSLYPLSSPPSPNTLERSKGRDLEPSPLIR